LPIFIAQSRKQVRQNVGLALGAIDIGAGAVEYTATSSNSTTTEVNATTAGFGSNEHVGRWTLFTDTGSSNAGLIRRVTASSTAGQLTLVEALSSASQTTTTFELWDQDVPPQMVNDAINRAIGTLSRKNSASAVDTSLHTGGGIRSFDLPSSTTISGVSAVEYRSRVTGVNLSDADSVWTNSDTSNLTLVQDDQDFRQGNGSNRFLAAAGFSAGAMGYDATSTATDLRGFTHIEAFVKSSSSHAASVFQIGVDNDTAFASPQEVNVGALEANTWTYQQMAFTSTQAATSTAIATVGLSSTSDPGTGVYVWVDNVKATRKGTEVWTTIHRRNWGLDRSGDKLEFKEGFRVPSYNMLRVSGWLIPTLPVSDTTPIPVDPEFLIYKSQAYIMRAIAPRRASQRDALLLDAERIDALAEDARRKSQHTIGGVRWRS